MDTIDGIICCFCDEVFQDLNHMKDHFKKDHLISLSKNCEEKYICKSEICAKKYNKLQSFTDHLNKEHLENGKYKSYVRKKTEKSYTHEDSSSINLDPLDLDGLMSKAIANLRFSTTITGADLGRCVGATKSLVSELVQNIHDRSEKFMKDKGIPDDEAKNFLDTIQFNNSFSNYETMKGQIAALKKHYDYIDPQERSFSNVDGKKEATFQYISWIEILKLVLSNKEIMDYLKNGPHTSEDEFSRSFEDGDTFKNHPFFMKHKDAIGFHAYVDDFLVNNPLGSKTKQQKVTVLYASCSNIPPHLRDYLGNVHVLALALSKDVASYGINQFLLPFVLDIRRLESDMGVKTKINGEDFVLRGTLLTVCADTLAAHEVLGFMGPSATYFCRLCTTSSKDRKSNPCLVRPLRTKESHDKAAEESERDQKKRSETGVKWQTILNILLYFHCTTNFSLDIMHDILEGIAHYDLKLFINYIISSTKLTVEMLNKRIESFQYGREELKNKPSANLTKANISNVSTDHKLQERAAQMWCLLRVFPFLVADVVSQNDPRLLHIIRLNQINEYVFSPKFKLSNLAQLDNLINDHVESFSSLFPDESIINKVHHALHFVLCMYKSGPLRHLSCFRYEAKHQIFKKYGSICCNFKNILKTLANISQMSQCSIWGTKRDIIRNKLEYNASASITDKVPFQIREALTKQDIHLDDNAKLVSKIGVYGTQYTLKSFVAIDRDPDNNNMPIFGKIEQIVVDKNQVYLYCKEYISQYLKESLNAFCVEEGVNFWIVCTEDLCDPKPFSLWKDFSDDKLSYICLRHLIF